MLFLGAISETLDGLEVAVCAFDGEDRALLWNRAFLRVFPEHASHIRSGEPYRANLRRFYEGRLDPTEMPFIERYIEEGLARHRQQLRPFSFEHRGQRITASSLPLPGVGRIRMWKVQTDDPGMTIEPAALALSAKGLHSGTDAVLLGLLAEGLTITDRDGQIVWANEAFLSMYGLSVLGQAVGKTFEASYVAAWQGCPATDHERFERGMALLRENLRFTGAPFEVPLPDGRWARVTHQRGSDGSDFSTHVDITMLKGQQAELRTAEERARHSNLLLEATLEKMEQGVMMVNAERIVEVCNRRAIELLELPESLMRSKPSFEQVLAYQWSQDDFRHTNQTIQEFVRAGGITDHPQTYDRRRPNGRVIEVQSVPLAGGGVLRTYTDITERRLGEERIRHMARHDGLTSLLNREVFLEHVAGSVQRAADRPEHRVAVHYIDLDRFKPINDEHGHAIGDRVLAIVSERMRRIARDTDVVARLGGDEFAILQHGLEGVEAAVGLARRVLAGIGEPIQVETLSLRVGASIGIALFPEHADNVDALLRNADLAMYAAKSDGRARVRVFASELPPSSPAKH